MFPIDITFKHLEPSQSLKNRILQEASKLEKLHNDIISAKVVVSLPHRSHNQGKIFHVSLTVLVSGKTLVVNHTPEKNHALEDAQVAIRDTFRAMEHELSKFINRRRERARKRQNNSDLFDGSQIILS